jgi:hypothetical protein
MAVSDMLDLETDSGLRRLLYLTAFLMIAFPLFQALAASYGDYRALGSANVRWRLGTTNNVVQNIQLPFIGLVLMLALARAMADKATSRIVGVFAAIGTLGFVMAIGLFALDSLQLRSIVSSKDMPAFNNALIRVGVALLLYLVAFLALTLVAFRSPQRMEKVVSKTGKRNPITEEPTGFLIGQDYTK